MDIEHSFQHDAQKNIEELHQQLLEAAELGNADEVLACILSMKDVKVFICFAAESAIKSKNSKGLLLLLKAGGNFQDYFSQFKNTPYHDPIRNKYNADAGYFGVPRMPDLDTSFSSPIIWAAYFGLTELLNYFLKTSDNINAIETVDCEKKYTPLIWAVARGHVDIVKFLIESGAQYELKNSANQNLVEIAIENNQAQALEYLLTTKLIPLCPVKISEAFYLSRAVKKQSLELVQVLLEAKLETVDGAKGAAFLQSAIIDKYRSDEMVIALLDAGANPSLTKMGTLSLLKEIYYHSIFFRSPTEIFKNVKNGPHPEIKTRCAVFFRLLCCMSNKEIKSFMNFNDFMKQPNGNNAEEIVKLFDKEMKAIRTRQLAAFGLAEIKSIIENLINFGYNFGASALSYIGAIQKEPTFTFPMELVNIIMRDPCLYPNWYKHRIDKDINAILDSFDRVHAKRENLTNELEYEKPKPVIFSVEKRKAENDLDEKSEQRILKKFKSNHQPKIEQNDDQLEAEGQEIEIETEIQMEVEREVENLISKKSTSKK